MSVHNQSDRMSGIDWVFREVESKVARPRYEHTPPSQDELIALAMADDTYNRTIRSAVCAILKQDGVEATIRCKNRDEAHISWLELSSAVADALRYGIFDCVDGKLRGMPDWDHPQVLLPRDVARGAVKLAILRLTGDKQSVGGRPMHPAKAWYEERGCDRAGRNVKELQRQMEAATGHKPPSANTIRGWERAFLSAETPSRNPK